MGYADGSSRSRVLPVSWGLWREDAGPAERLVKRFASATDERRMDAGVSKHSRPGVSSVATAASAVAAIAASVGCALSLTSWVIPYGDSVISAVLLVGFALMFVGLGLIFALVSRDVDFSAAWATLPKLAQSYLVALVSLGLASALAGLIQSRGWQQNSENALPGCRWPLVADHGEANICVSHARWLATGRSDFRFFMAVLTGILVVQCVALLSRRDPAEA